MDVGIQSGSQSGPAELVGQAAAGEQPGEISRSIRLSEQSQKPSGTYKEPAGRRAVTAKKGGGVEQKRSSLCRRMAT